MRSYICTIFFFRQVYICAIYSIRFLYIFISSSFFNPCGWRLTSSFLGKTCATIRSLLHDTSIETQRLSLVLFYVSGSAAASSSPSLSIWRRKKEMAKEGLIAAKELKRLQSNPVRLDRFIFSHVSRLLKSDLVSVLAELQRQYQVFLSMKVLFLFVEMSQRDVLNKKALNLNVSHIRLALN
ncbi:protein THYLAKOID ASSEMBLY 8-like, chloroplastic [Hibiscus syriacus]|uniref:protein THYLAKOID ASSEMBLY 8-like, chloroplastic n=1 Tax=Hibiscus syriacus TaxID=106335 RepID=UPI001921A16B|nr:protein THYLAKOID ASSEMBLY 8-like, chloroplastic [Hibiscus syriacus]